VTHPRRPKPPHPSDLLPSTYRRLAVRDGVHQHDTFDPAVKQFQRAMRAGEPAFDDLAMGQRWRTARRTAMEHILAVVAESPWAKHLVLRGSVLLKAWLGDEAREPGDIDWVVSPLTMMLDDRRTADMLDGLVAAIRARPDAGPISRSPPRSRAENIWTYERAPGRRLVFTWSTVDAPDGTVQCDFVFNERLPLPAAPTTVAAAGRRRAGDRTRRRSGAVAGLEDPLAGHRLLPAGQGSLRRGVACRTDVPAAGVAARSAQQELGADAEQFTTADRVLGWRVDWEELPARIPVGAGQRGGLAGPAAPGHPGHLRHFGRRRVGLRVWHDRAMILHTPPASTISARAPCTHC